MTSHRSATADVLELLVPGLLGPIPPQPDGLQSTPTLDLLLARARQSTPSGADQRADLNTALLACFGAEASAPYSRAADDPAWDRDGFCMHADPVHLRPDRDLLRLFDARHLGIAQDEADQLTAELNGFFAADGLRFMAPTASRWYVHCRQPLALRTQPLARVIGEHIDGLLPAGVDAARWASLMNEAQMLLFQSSVNQRREAGGRSSVNGLWCWGGGVWRDLVDAVPAAQRPQRIWARSSLARGLAAASGALVEPLWSAWQPHSGSALVVVDQVQDALLDANDRGWGAAVEALDQWLGPALAALRAGRLDEIVVDACNGRRWSLSRADLRRFWRRPRPLATLAARQER
ncbi:MAG: phosphoglycerate mutase [Thiohalocapsa sp.]